MINIGIIKPISAPVLFAKSGIQIGNIYFGNLDEMIISMKSLIRGLELLKADPLQVNENAPVHEVFDLLVRAFDESKNKYFGSWCIKDGNIICTKYSKLANDCKIYNLKISSIDGLPNCWQKVMEMLCSILYHQQNIFAFWDNRIIEYWEETDEEEEPSMEIRAEFIKLEKTAKARFTKRCTIKQLKEAFHSARGIHPINYKLDEAIHDGILAAEMGIKTPSIDSIRDFGDTEFESGAVLPYQTIKLTPGIHDDLFENTELEWINEQSGNFGAEPIRKEIIITPTTRSIDLEPISPMYDMLKEFIESFDILTEKNKWKKLR